MEPMLKYNPCTFCIICIIEQKRPLTWFKHSLKVQTKCSKVQNINAKCSKVQPKCKAKYPIKVLINR